MTRDTVRFEVSRLAAVAESLPVEWQGVRYDSGPLGIHLDAEVASVGELDYASRTARAEFHLFVKFPEFAGVLAGLGADSMFTRPIKAVLRSEGEILADHSFVLGGKAELAEHALFPREETSASVRHGH